MVMDDGPPDDDLEAMLASYEQDVPTSQRPKSPSFSDDEYDDVFADFIPEEPAQPPHAASQSDHSDAMQFSEDMMF